MDACIFSQTAGNSSEDVVTVKDWEILSKFYCLPGFCLGHDISPLISVPLVSCSTCSDAACFLTCVEEFFPAKIWGSFNFGSGRTYCVKCLTFLSNKIKQQGLRAGVSDYCPLTEIQTPLAPNWADKIIYNEFFFRFQS